MPSPNAGTLEQAINACYLSLLDSHAPNIAEQVSPNAAKEKLLPYLAQAQAVPFWHSELTPDEKRQLIQDSPQYYEQAGTANVIDKALTLLNFDHTLTPWYEIPDAQPYTATLTIKLSREIGQETYDTLKRFLRRLLNLRDAIDVNLVLAPKVEHKTQPVLITAERIQFTPSN